MEQKTGIRIIQAPEFVDGHVVDRRSMDFKYRGNLTDRLTFLKETGSKFLVFLCQLFRSSKSDPSVMRRYASCVSAFAIKVTFQIRDACESG